MNEGDELPAFEFMTPDKRPQDHPRQDGTGLTFTTLEHGGDEPDNMPQAILLTDAEGRSCIYVPFRIGAGSCAPRTGEARNVVTTHSDACSKCARRNPISYRVEPEEAWRTVVLNRWRILCPSCFDAEAEKAGVRYSFTDLEGQSWSDRPAPRNPYKRKR